MSMNGLGEVVADMSPHDRHMFLLWALAFSGAPADAMREALALPVPAPEREQGTARDSVEL